jgi:thioredoxin 1
MSTKNVIEFTDANFVKDVEQSKGLVFVDFWAPWCGPCRQVGPIVDQIADENVGKLRVGKVNTDESQEVALKYNVMSIPTLMLFKDGKLVERMMGAQPKERLMQKIRPHLGETAKA